MAFHFKLGKLLGYKESLLREAREKLALAQFEKDRLQERKRCLEEQLVELDERIQEEIGRGTTIGAVQMMQFQKGCAQSQLHQLGLELKAQKKIIEEALEALAQRNREVKELEKLKENQWELHDQETKRQETLRLDEYIATSMVMNQAN